MSQSYACSLFLAKTNEKDACFRVPQSSSLPQSCAKEKSSGVEIALCRHHLTHALYHTTWAVWQPWTAVLVFFGRLHLRDKADNAKAGFNALFSAKNWPNDHTEFEYFVLSTVEFIG